MQQPPADSVETFSGEEDERSVALVDPTEYDDRPGYQADFLGPEHRISVPRVTGDRADDAVQVLGGGVELRFWTYSTVMSRTRRIPVLSAGNFDRESKASLARPTAWLLDPRLDVDPAAGRALQVTDDWYKHQNSSGLGRGPFDRGHLTAFENAEWGDDPLRNGTDSFHFTNCAPQASSFNEHKVWRQIEVWAAQQGTSGRVSMFNGAVFDGPPSTPLDNDLFQLNPMNPGTLDPMLQGVAIPKQYFKIAAYVKDGKLAVQSFIATQEGYFAAIDELTEPDEVLSEVELTLYRVPIAYVRHLTSLDFGVLEDDAVTENEAVSEPQMIRELSDLV